jgi:drug/metabolite transporter (DMT)-like permease
VLPYAGLMLVLRKMSVFTVNVTYNLEPIYGMILAAWCFGESEKMTSGFYAGATVIVLTVLLTPWLTKSRAPA